MFEGLQDMLSKGQLCVTILEVQHDLFVNSLGFLLRTNDSSKVGLQFIKNRQEIENMPFVIIFHFHSQSIIITKVSNTMAERKLEQK